MARNVEIKARVHDPAALRQRAEALASAGPELIEQDDTFFSCANGRLKLRQFGPASGELIFYRRADDPGPKTSFYVRSATAEPATLREALTLAHGQDGRVRKLRTLFLVGRTRVHLDEVEGLGHFMELEVVLADGEPAQAGEAEARALMQQLGVQADDLVDVAYVDLLAQRGSGSSSTSRNPTSG